VSAVGSSTSIDRAKGFITDNGLQGAKAFGTYQEVVDDSNVQVVYIASPASHHYANAIMAIKAGKHVCCEVLFFPQALSAAR
jgi:predicted dehydrogenase